MQIRVNFKPLTSLDGRMALAAFACALEDGDSFVP